MTLTLVTIKGVFTSAPPTKLKPHDVEGEFLRNVTRSSLVLPPINTPVAKGDLNSRRK